MSVEITHEEAHQVGESIRRARQIMDDRLRGLTLADRFWRITLLAPKEERLAYAHELDGYGLFSLTQIGKITRTHKATLAKALGAKKRPGGRFEPQGLRTLATLRRNVIEGRPISLSQMEDLAANGTSVSCASRLIGISAQYQYQRLREAA